MLELVFDGTLRVVANVLDPAIAALPRNALQWTSFEHL